MQLTGCDIAKITGVVFIGGAATFVVYNRFLTGKKNHINPSVQKDKSKVATIINVDDLTDEKTAFCRCWRTGKFPYCDGSHNGHNALTGDNVAPIVIVNKKPEAQ